MAVDQQQRFLRGTARAAAAVVGAARWRDLPELTPEIEAAIDLAAESSIVVSLVESGSWAQSVIRLLASTSNLSIAHRSVAVVGTGPIAAAIVTAISRMGARVTVVGDDAVALLAFSEQGLEVHAVSTFAAAPNATFVFATGETRFAVTADSFDEAGEAVVLVDAALPGRASAVAREGWAGADPIGRDGLVGLAGGPRDVFLLAAAEIAGTGFEAASGDIRTGFALELLALLSGADGERAVVTGALIDAADTALAESVLA